MARLTTLIIKESGHVKNTSKVLKIGKNNIIYIPSFPIISGNVFPEKVNEKSGRLMKAQQNSDPLFPSQEFCIQYILHSILIFIQHAQTVM